jgi:hypothetical protein
LSKSLLFYFARETRETPEKKDKLKMKGIILAFLASFAGNFSGFIVLCYFDTAQ